MSEPVGVMKCWECIEKHGRDLEHHFEDLVRTTKEPKERLKYEDWIDRIREIRREAHKNAKDIGIDESLKIALMPKRFPEEFKRMARRGELEQERKPLEYERMPSRYDRYKKSGIIEHEEEVDFSEPIRVERGEKVWSEIFHEKEECDPKSFRTLKPNPQHLLSTCCPKGQYSEEAARCLVGTMAHKLEHLHPEKRGGCSVCEALA